MHLTSPTQTTALVFTLVAGALLFPAQTRPPTRQEPPKPVTDEEDKSTPRQQPTPAVQPTPTDAPRKQTPSSREPRGTDKKADSKVQPADAARYDYAFGRDAVDRLKESGADVSQLESDVKRLEAKNLNEAERRELFIKITDETHVVAKRAGVESRVTFITTKAGARVSYQTIGERRRGEEPFSSNGTTTCEEHLPIGYYYVWTHRNGKDTSDRNELFKLLRQQQRLQLTERD